MCTATSLPLLPKLPWRKHRKIPPHPTTLPQSRRCMPEVLPSHPDGMYIVVTLCMEVEVLLCYLLLWCIKRCNVCHHLPPFAYRKAYAAREKALKIMSCHSTPP